MSSARPEEGGLAAGIVNTSYQVGSALGLAAMTAVAAANGADQLGDVTSLTDGYSAAFLGAAIVAAVGAVIAAVTLRLPKPQPQAAAAETEAVVLRRLVLLDVAARLERREQTKDVVDNGTKMHKDGFQSAHLTIEVSGIDGEAGGECDITVLRLCVCVVCVCVCVIA